jgi:hypothetical protein
MTPTERWTWETAFLAVSVALGEPLDQAEAALGPGAARVAALSKGLRASSRGMRAGVLAAALAPVALEIEQMGLR